MSFWPGVNTLYIAIVAIVRASDISRKKSKIWRDFQGQIRGKIGRFRGIFEGKTSRNSQKNRPISLGFTGKKPNFEGFSGANSRKNRPISREISEGNFAKKQSINNN